MRVSIGEAAGGSKTAADAYAALGVNLADIIDLPADQQLMAIARWISQCGRERADHRRRDADFREKRNDDAADLSQGRRRAARDGGRGKESRF